MDTFVVYDNIKYTKKGWINRNRWLQNGAGATFTLPLDKGSDALDIGQRTISADFDPRKFLNQLRANYAKAPCFDATYALVESLLPGAERQLFGVLLNSVCGLCRHLGITADIRVSSTIAADHTLQAQDRVLDLCRATGAGTYLNAIGGTQLYAEQDFADAGVALRFVRSKPIEYPQFGAPFVPWLSIVDVLMFNPVSTVRGYLGQCELMRAAPHG